MSLFDDVKNLLGSAALGASTSGEPSAHFEQFAQSVDPTTLAQGIAASIRSDDTPPFAHLVSQLFSSASDDQKSTIVNTLLSAVTPDQRAHLSMLIPGMGTAASLSSEHAATISPMDIQSLAQGVEQHDAGIIDKMSALYAAHPTLIKTLGVAGLTVAMRHIAAQQNQRA